jgi:hypothetical protein
MSTIKGLPGPLVSPLATSTAASTARGVSGASFLSRVQAASAGAVSPSGAAPGVSGRAIVSSAVASARQEAAAAGAQDAAASPADPALQQKKAVEEMSRSFLMGTMQSIFQGIGEAGPKAPDND